MPGEPTSIASLLADLAAAGVELWLEGDRLRFRAPRDALTPALRERLAAQRDAVIASLTRRAKSAAHVAAMPPVVPAPRDTRLPLSFAQERLWFLQQLEPASALYNHQFALRLRGTLDRRALGAALSDIVARHEVLRTRFPADDGQPFQDIQPASPVDLPAIDLTDLPATQRDAALHDTVARDAHRPFDLVHGPLVRSVLVHCDTDDHVLIVSMHHVLIDHWSFAIFARELVLHYAARSHDLPTPLPPLPVQYADFAVAQRAWLRGDVLDAQLGYWQRQLARLGTLDLPTDRPRALQASSAGDALMRTVPSSLAAGVRALGAQRGLTPFMTYLAAYSALLARHAGSDDVVTGTPIAGRDRPELEGLVGLFLNTLVLRVATPADATVEQLLAHTRAMAVDAYAHQHVPFEKLVEALRPGRDAGRHPLFQVMFNVQNTPQSSAALPGLVLETVQSETRLAKFDLTLTLEASGDGMIAGWDWSTDLYDRATIERLATHFERVLEAMVRAPGASIGSLPLVSPDERAASLARWNAQDSVAPATDVLTRFEREARRAPDATALVTPDGVRSYAWLDRRAEQIAHGLRAHGVVRESIVGVLLDRSPDFVATLLAVFKSGGAYLPLDPALPPLRIADMLADARARWVVTRSGHTASLPTGLTAIALDAGETDAKSWKSPGGSTQARPGDLAYVVYTSGSTGRPKGVAISRGALAHHAQVVAARYGLTREDRVLQFAAVGFDVAAEEIFPTLAVGAAVVLQPDLAARPVADVGALLEGDGVTVANLPSSWWHAWVADLAQRSVGAPASLRLLVVGSEPPRAAALETWSRIAPDTRWLNAYGPSEATITAATFDPHEDPASARRAAPGVPIGRALAGVRMYVLDARGEPVAPGVVGEVLLAGPTLARGYLGRPGHTADRFVPDPFGAPGSRRLRTGDLARLDADGVATFAGRADRQVKVRGIRIELAEIEAVLTEFEGVRDAVVELMHDAQHGPQLVAYVVGAPGVTAPSAQALRAHARQRLVAAMVPGAFVSLTELPRGPSGKIDRRALPVPDATPQTEVTFEPPRTALERAAADLFAAVLHRERVGRDDDFFALGGHSLLATQLVARARATLGVELPLRAIFAAPTVAGLAQALAVAPPRDGVAPPVSPAGQPGPFPLSFGQERLWFLDQFSPGARAFHLPVAVRLLGALDLVAWSAALDALVERHASLRTRFVAVEGRAVQVVDAPHALPMPVTDLTDVPLSAREQTARQRADALVRAPFDLAHGPLVRVELLRLSATDHVAVLVLHHIVGDGWSLGLLVRELTLLYGAAATGRTSPLPPPTLQYTDYAVWQRAWLRDAALEAQRSWWLGKLAGAPPALELPTDGPRPAVQRYRGASVPLAIASEVVQQARALGRAEGASLFMVLIGAYAAWLARQAETDDVVIGTDIAGRHHAGLEALVGFFVNQLVLRIDVGGRASGRTVIARTREFAFGAFAHQDLPFEMLVRDLNPVRDPTRAPVFQVKFQLQNTPPLALELPGVALQPFDAATGTTQFDLTLTLVERPDGSMAGQFAYDRDLFTETAVSGWAGQFTRLLAGLVATPDAPVATLPVLDALERARVLEHWNATVVPGPGVPMPASLAAWIARTPDAPAVTSGAVTVSYAQLDSRANQLANVLRAAGVGTDAPVAVCLARSIELVVALLAVLKAGGAYVPLDPSHPPARLALVAQDARCVLALVDRSSADVLPPDAAPRVLHVDDASIAAASTAPPADTAPHTAAAYVLYTSGSTGRPKGVVVSRGALANLLGALRQATGLAPGRTLLAVTTVAFDIAALELWLPLATGAHIVLASRDDATDGARLLALRSQHGVDVLQATPATWRLLRATDPTARLDGLVALVGGEAVPRDLADDLISAGATVWNVYGPTETTVWSTAARVTVEAGPVPIGPPLANTRAYVVDAHDAPTPPGARGRLYLAGAGLARGYAGRAGLTAERFVPDPFSATPGARRYDTGDRARWRHDGQLEFAGRADHQIKLRGFRIEPGEIEAALHLAVPDASAVAVVAREDRLVAYLVRPADASPWVAETVRTALRATLPEYMVPAVFVALDALPRTPNNKLDRRALPAPPDDVADATGREDSAPRTPTETQLAALFADVLRVPHVGRHDDFFARGGHSLLAAQLVARARTVLGRELPLRARSSRIRPSRPWRTIWTRAHRPRPTRRLSRLGPIRTPRLRWPSRSRGCGFSTSSTRAAPRTYCRW